MARIWKQLQALLEPPKHPGDSKQPVKPIDTELQAVKAAWQSEQTIVAARAISPCWSFLTGPDRCYIDGIDSNAPEDSAFRNTP